MNFLGNRSHFLIKFTKRRFSLTEKDQESMTDFYKKLREKMNKEVDLEDANPSKLKKIWKFRNTFAWTSASLILLNHSYYFLSSLFLIGGIHRTIKDLKLNQILYILIEEWFAFTKNKQVFYGYEVIKKYVLNHPDIRGIYQDSNSIFYANTWTIYDNLGNKAGFLHEDSLHHKRYQLVTKLTNLHTKENATIHSRILFFTPSEFEIEYLRADLGYPTFKKITIIDGRAETKDWIHEIDPKKINKTSYKKYREEGNIKY